jgi:hypothetical protein
MTTNLVGRLPAAAKFCAALVLCVLLGACDEEAPGRFPTNQREAAFEVTSSFPTGQVTLEGSLTRITVTVDRIPILPSSGFLYGAWLTYLDVDTNRVDVSAGVFRVTGTIPSDPADRVGAITMNYDAADGDLEVTSGGTALADGEPFPGGVNLTDGVTFFLAVEPDPDNSPNPGVIHPVVAAEPLPAVPGSVSLIVPVNIGLETAGDFSDLDGTALVNAATGEFQLGFSTMPVFTRTSPPDDPGLVYQVWFVDDDLSPPRYVNIDRFVPNPIGDFSINGPPPFIVGDLDGDGAPESIDFERILISVEPDGLNAQQQVGDGIDTSGQIFPIVPYRIRLPEPNQ